MADSLRILLVEDNPGDERLLREHLGALEQISVDIHSVAELERATIKLNAEAFDVVLADLGLPDSEGLSTVASLLANAGETPVVVLTGADDRELAERAIHAGAQDYLPKNVVTPELLSRTITHAIERQRARETIRQSEQRFRAVFEASPLAIAILRANEREIITANRAFSDLLGYGDDEIPSLSMAEVTHPNDLAEDLRGVQAILDGSQETFAREKRLIRKGGDTIWVGAVGTVLKDSAGKPEQILLVLQDITAEKEATLALEAERKRLHSVVETMPAFLYLQAPDHTIPFVNSRFREYFGDPEGRTCHQIFRGSDASCAPCLTLEVLETQEELIREWTDDQGRVFELRERPFTSADGGKLVLVIGAEITDLIQATADLRVSELRFRELAEMLPEVVFECDLDGNLSFVNRIAYEQFGYSFEEFDQGLSALDMLIPEERSIALENIARVLGGSKQNRSRYTAIRTDGSTFPVIIHSAPISIDGKPSGLRGILVDITEQVEAQRTTQESEIRHRLLFESAPVGIGYFTAEGDIISLNRIAASRLGGEPADFIGMNVAEYSQNSTEGLRRIALAASSRGSKTYEDTTDSAAGLRHVLRSYTAIRDVNDNVVGVQLISSDITDQKNAELRFQIAATTASDLIYEWDMSTDNLQWFGDIDAALGFPPGTTPNSVEGWRKLVHPDDLKTMTDASRSHRTSTTPIHQEYRVKTADGSWRTWLDRSTPVLGDSGAPERWIGVCEDITSQKLADDALRTADDIIRSSPVGMFIYQCEDSDRLILVDANPEAEKLTRIRLSEWRGRELNEIWPEAQAAGLTDAYLAAFNSNTIYSTDDLAYRDRSISGRFRIRAFRIPRDRLAISIEDVSELREAEQALRRSEIQYRSLFENAALGIYQTTPDGRILAANPALVKLLGYSSFEELAARNLEEEGYEPETPRSDFKQRLEQDGSFVGRESSWTRKDGTPVYIRENARVVRDDSGNTIYYEGTLEDITEQKASVAALQQSEENYRTIFDSASDAIMLYDSETGQLLDANQKVAEMYGYPPDEFLQLQVEEFSSGIAPYTQDDALERIHAAARGEPQLFEWQCKRRNADLFWVEVSLRQVTLLGASVVLAVVRDISERKELEAKLRQNQRLESIGTLASGVAHEINNPLMGMINYAELISSRVGDESLREFAEGIKEEGDRVAKIVRSLLSFSRQDQEQHSLARMSDIVDASLSLIGSLLRKDFIQLSVDVSEELPCVRCRSQQIQQVLINLVTNARDSLNKRFAQSGTDKKVRILSWLVCDDDRQWLRTTVEDFGTGIPDDIINRVFDPFFTTKPRDEGTGLGLSISYGIVCDHDGRLIVESEPGYFARFHVDLPVPEDGG